MIFQEPMSSLNPCFTVGFQIGETLKTHLGLDRKQRAGRVIELLREVGIPDPERRVRAFPHQLSGGMSQRVMIAMALACRPKLLIADEPTTALDVTIQAQILDLLLSLRRQNGMALVLITHDMGVVAETADRVIVQYAGRQVEANATDALFANPRHPYTHALLAALPERATARRLPAIAGVVPGAIRPTRRLSVRAALPLRAEPLPQRRAAAPGRRARPRAVLPAARSRRSGVSVVLEARGTVARISRRARPVLAARDREGADRGEFLAAGRPHARRGWRIRFRQVDAGAAADFDRRRRPRARC